MITAAAIGIVLIASVVQKLTGTGFALVATPAMVLLFGASQGVVLVVLLGIIVSAVMLIRPGIRVHWPRALKLLAAGVLFSPIGFAMVYLLPEPWLMIFVSAAAAFSLYTGMRRRRVHFGERWHDVVLAGASSGILHVTSGLSGPPLIGYALKTKWDQAQFILTIQVIFIGFHLLTIGVRGLPVVPVPILLMLVATTFVGIVIANLSQRHISAIAIKRLMLTIAWVGTIAVLIRGVFDLIGV